MSSEEMDRSRDEAAAALSRIPQDAVRIMANWWNQWYRSAGHRRLGRLLLTKKGTLLSPLGQQAVDGHIRGDSSGELRARTIDLGSHYILAEAPLDSSAFFAIDEIAAEIRIILNSEHPAFKTIKSALHRTRSQNGGESHRSPDEREILLMLLKGWAEVERHQPHGSRRTYAQMAREDWGRAVRDLFVNPNRSE